jgi:hypothetical protein
MEDYLGDNARGRAGNGVRMSDKTIVRGRVVSEPDIKEIQK